MTRALSPTAADLPPDAPIADRIVALRCDGTGIAKRLEVPHAEVHAALADWAANYFGPDRRSTMLGIVTSHLERLFNAHKEKAYKGDIQATNACLKVCAHLASMHGLYQPSIAAVNNRSTTIIDARPQSAHARLEEALQRLLQDQRREQQEARVVEADAEPAGTEH